MKLIMSEQHGDCMLASLAMILNTNIAFIKNTIHQYDFPYHIQQLQFVCHQVNSYLVEYHNQQDIVCSNGEIKSVERRIHWDFEVLTRSGIGLIGIMKDNVPHMIAYSNGVMYDPDGRMYSFGAIDGEIIIVLRLQSNQ